MSKRIRACVIGLAVLVGSLATPGTALAKKPPKPGGGGNDPVCLTFPNPGSGAGVESDGGGVYCNNKKGKIEAIMSSNSVTLRTNTSSHRDPEAGRKLFVDLAPTPCSVEDIGIDLKAKPDLGCFLRTTDDLAAKGISHSENFWLKGVDLRAMRVPTMGVPTTRTDARLLIRIFLTYPDGTSGSLLIYFDPDQGSERACHGADGMDNGSTYVTVMRTGTDSWEIEVDATDLAGLSERFDNTVWCRTDDGEGLLELRPFKVTVKLRAADGGGGGISETLFVRGDCNDDGKVDLSDAVCILNGLFAGGGAPGCLAATNTNGDDAANIADATYLLNFLFAGGPAPVAPFPDCGPGMLPADDQLGCENPPNC